MFTWSSCSALAVVRALTRAIELIDWLCISALMMWLVNGPVICSSSDVNEAVDKSTPCNQNGTTNNVHGGYLLRSLRNNYECWYLDFIHNVSCNSKQTKWVWSWDEYWYCLVAEYASQTVGLSILRCKKYLRRGVAKSEMISLYEEMMIIT